jgi:hypothetical protein
MKISKKGNWWCKNDLLGNCTWTWKETKRKRTSLKTKLLKWILNLEYIVERWKEDAMQNAAKATLGPSEWYLSYVFYIPVWFIGVKYKVPTELMAHCMNNNNNTSYYRVFCERWKDSNEE